MNSKIMKDRKICVITIYFGDWPAWFPLFLNSCKFNPDIDFLIFSDHVVPLDLTSNIRSVPFTMKDFNHLATEKLNLKINIKTPYKLCDFKPAFGRIFNDYLPNYDFWGYCDIDLIFGKIRSSISDRVLEKYDIISTYNGYLSGPFCLLKNIPVVCNLYRNSSNVGQLLMSDQPQGFDENIPRKSNEGFHLYKAVVFLLFLLKIVFRSNFQFNNLPEIRYQFQWYFKKIMLKNHSPHDMTEVIWQAKKNVGIKFFHRELVLSGNYFQRNRKKNWILIWNKTGLIDMDTKKELFAFHLRGSHLLIDYTISPTIQPQYQITETGIF
jgi:hypothetical protein